MDLVINLSTGLKKMILPESQIFKAHHIGIALAQTAIRAVEIDKNGDITNSAQVRMPAGYLQSESVDQEALAQGLKSLAEQGKFSTKYAAVCIPEKFAYSRQHTLPSIPITEVTEAIRWQIEDIFPFSSQDVYTDWKLLSSDKNQTKVLVMAIQRKFLDSLRIGFEIANIVPISFEPSASAITRLIPQSDSQALIVLELDPTGTTSTLVVDETALITATTHFTTESDPNQVLLDITTTIKSLMTRAQKPDNQEENKWQIILTGEKASDQIATLLNQQLSTPAKTLSLPQTRSEFHLAYAVGIMHISPPDDTKTINLLPTELEAEYQQAGEYDQAKRALQIVGAISAIAIIIALIGAITSFIWTRSESNQVTQLQAQAESQSQDLGIGSINQYAQRINTLFPSKTSPESSIAEVYSIIPQGIEIRSLSLDSSKDNITLTGRASTRASLLELHQALEELDIINKVNLPLSNLASPANTEFVLEISLAKEPVNE